MDQRREARHSRVTQVVATRRGEGCLLDDLIVAAADRLQVSKTTFVCDAVREAALKVVARAEVTMMTPEVFDSMMASIDVADESPELESLAAMPRLITR